ncbi:chorismate lyase [Oxalobacteraceae bacterium OTU3CAMAD1]|nr:chorismate lyase [Oxalobacteraceae bacterium OTU3CAMAD1]
MLALNAPPSLRPWLTAGGSLTERLKDHSQTFRVQCLHQRVARCLSDEAAAIGLHRPGRVWEREVLLRCDNTPVVFAHTVVPMSATAADWPLFSALGERSLGTTLFGDPQVRRGVLEFARLREGHPLAQRAAAALDIENEASPQERILYARRCLYRRRQGTLLVTEVFLPSVLDLKQQHSHNE